MDSTSGYVLAGCLGAAIGATELASRYRDDPGRSVLQPAALLYVLTNAAASVAAVAIIRVFGWTFGQTGAARDLVQTLAGGLGAIALFRTKLFAAAEKGSNFNWGPGGLLERILAVSDRQVDRYQAKRRSQVAREVMSGVSFDRVYVTLPALALSLLENSSPDDQSRLKADVIALKDDELMSPEDKSLLLGVAVMRITGVQLLVRAVAGLSGRDGVPAPRRKPPVTVPSSRRSPSGT
ncbi:hypothetical protein [Symbioplanes lichenis]|uniref:hypothetical protein n=1 Tax=Symbioplanes lichenis TaxID=1629072 RepID=UPI002739048C|nr:hypothetical protein [Actinoplanes lichenis]